MKYNRKISNSFASLMEDGGKLRWLFNFVKGKNELDFLIGKNNSKEWISVYRGLSRLYTIKKSKHPDIINIDGAQVYKNIIPVLIISDYNYNSTAMTKFDEVLELAREKLNSGFSNKLKMFNFTWENGLSMLKLIYKTILNS